MTFSTQLCFISTYLISGPLRYRIVSFSLHSSHNCVIDKSICTLAFISVKCLTTEKSNFSRLFLLERATEMNQEKGRPKFLLFEPYFGNTLCVHSEMLILQFRTRKDFHQGIVILVTT